jgi:hypothetical protein
VFVEIGRCSRPEVEGASCFAACHKVPKYSANVTRPRGAACPTNPPQRAFLPLAADPSNIPAERRHAQRRGWLATNPLSPPSPPRCFNHVRKPLETRCRRDVRTVSANAAAVASEGRRRLAETHSCPALPVFRVGQAHCPVGRGLGRDTLMMLATPEVRRRAESSPLGQRRLCALRRGLYDAISSANGILPSVAREYGQTPLAAFANR